jgi:hypothetical protein
MRCKFGKSATFTAVKLRGVLSVEGRTVAVGVAVGQSHVVWRLTRGAVRTTQRLCRRMRSKVEHVPLLRCPPARRRPVEVVHGVMDRVMDRVVGRVNDWPPSPQRHQAEISQALLVADVAANTRWQKQ